MPGVYRSLLALSGLPQGRPPEASFFQTHCFSMFFFQIRLIAPQEAPRGHKMAPRGPQEGRIRLPDGTRRPQDSPETAQDGTKRAQDRPNTPQDGPNMASRQKTNIPRRSTKLPLAPIKPSHRFHSAPRRATKLLLVPTKPSHRSRSAPRRAPESQNH